jgi:predicted GH43/DUF377 family glycosyl hydrolase
MSTSASKRKRTGTAGQPGLRVERLDLCLQADPRRVLLRRYPTSGVEQARNVISRVLALPQSELPPFIEAIMQDFEGRHRDFRQVILERYREIRHLLATDQDLSEERQMLLGASFSMEYSLECAALFNPSIVPHPDQTGLSEGALRFILSLRATGEGHISSITFRVGTVDAEGVVQIEPASRFVVEPKAVPNPTYERALFGRKLHELGLSSAFTRRVVQALDDEFTLQELRDELKREHWRGRNLEPEADQIANLDDKILSLALSNYQVRFRPDQEISEQVLFPVTPSQSNGIEDARFVRFEDGTYYGTYTAYDGRMIMPQLVETEDFVNYRFITLNGPAVKNKGMALFPRKINGLYTMLGRQDGENLTLMMSDNIHFWNESEVIVRPKFPWELVQIGNCGSPIETEAGWLVLTHGVGPTRKYSIGVLLLNRDDPSRVIGRLEQPLLSPNSEEREGYVPNVVYTCGAMVHGENLIVPYAVSDSATKFARVNLAELLNAMT